MIVLNNARLDPSSFMSLLSVQLMQTNTTYMEKLSHTLRVPLTHMHFLQSCMTDGSEK